jgi:hypothetical protein
MKRLEFICDGCDFVDHIGVENVQNLEYMLKGWVTHRIIAHENGSQAYEILADLCPNCSENLRRAINPANWPRLRSSRSDSYGGEIPQRRDANEEGRHAPELVPAKRADYSSAAPVGNSLLRERNPRIQAR